jgi:predicted signal transduction protein with EAL and GGDEF domain
VRGVAIDILAATAAGALALALAGSALRSTSNLEVARARSEAADEAAELGARLVKRIEEAAGWLDKFGDALSAGMPAPTLPDSLARSNLAAWRTNGSAHVQVTVAGGDAVLTAADVDDAVARAVGPIAVLNGANGDDFIVLRTAPKHSDLSLSLRLANLLDEAGLTALLKKGMQVAIDDLDSGETFLWSNPEPLGDAMQIPLSPAGAHWRLSIAPASGWRNMQTVWTGLVVAWLLAVGYAVTYLLLARKPRALAEQVDSLRERLEQKDGELATLVKTQSALETQLLSSLTIDVATGLQNRRSFIDHLQESLKTTRLTSGGALLVLVVRFRQLHEIGHSMGSTFADRLLAQAADRLVGACKGDCFLARVAENELALALNGSDTDGPADIAERLLGELDERFDVGPRALFTPACIGFAASPDGYEYPEEFLSKASLAADAALEDQKRWSVFRLETKEKRIDMLQLEADLQKAIRGEEFQLHFQPILSVAEGSVVGFEVLLRWHHGSDSWIGPDRFIPLAEEIGQMSRLSDWVTRKTITQGRHWLDTLKQPLYLTLNLTPRDLSREFCDRLFDELAAAGLPPERLRVEVTESAVVKDFRAAARLISELHERGIRVLLDDFGTGYSSLSYLRDLPFSAVKIDKSFIRKMTTEARDFGLVRSIVSLVHYLGMECIAEGIETQEQLDLIEIANCNYWQGFLFSAAVPADRVADLMERTRMPTAAQGAVA